MQTLSRTAFTTDRTLEFFTESELTTQMGYRREDWPLAIAKELIDNALDACEIGNTAPEISVVVEDDALTISDNGPGIPPEVIEKSLNYHIRVSDKKNYVSPTRGQLGNALKCVWAAPFVANGAHHGLVEVTARGIHHTIDVSLDRIRQEPVLDHTQEPSVKNGTSVKVHWSQIACCEIYRWAGSYQEKAFCGTVTFAQALGKTITEFAAFNPHASFHFGDLHFEASNPEWQKWRTDQPTSPHWYRVHDLRNLIAGYIAEGDRPVRDFLGEFAGLSGTQIRQKVLNQADIPGAHLSDLVTNGDVNLEKVTSLLAAMRQHSKPLKPQRLGVIGQEHLERTLARAGADECKYWKNENKCDDEGLPFVIELAFGYNRDKTQRLRRILGLNWTPVLKNPSGHISRALNDCRVQESDPIILLVHLARPRFAFSDHGKGSLAE